MSAWETKYKLHCESVRRNSKSCGLFSIICNLRKSLSQTSGKYSSFYFVLEAKMGLFGNRFLTDLFFALFWMRSILTDVTPYNFSLWNSLYLHKPIDIKYLKTDVMEKCLNKSVLNLWFHFCKPSLFPAV